MCSINKVSYEGELLYIPELLWYVTLNNTDWALSVYINSFSCFKHFKNTWAWYLQQNMQHTVLIQNATNVLFYLNLDHFLPAPFDQEIFKNKLPTSRKLCQKTPPRPLSEHDFAGQNARIFTCKHMFFVACPIFFFFFFFFTKKRDFWHFLKKICNDFSDEIWVLKKSGFRLTHWWHFQKCYFCIHHLVIVVKWVHGMSLFFKMFWVDNQP